MFIVVGGNMKVVIMSKVGCPRCMLLKQKMKLMGVKYEEIGADDMDIGDRQFPVAVINGVLYEYADAIKRLKG